MTKKLITFTFNFTGGIIAPGPLLQLLDIAAEAQAAKVRFGLRQQLFIDIPEDKATQFRSNCEENNFIPATTPNIMSSYLTEGIFNSSNWLGEGVYKDIFSLFDYTPKLKINICDSQQTFVPLFTGHINWVASQHKHYWHLYLRLQGSESLFSWPVLIYTSHIALISKAAETCMLKGMSAEACYQVIQQQEEYVQQAKNEEPVFPLFHLPYYEGFNKTDSNYWLGIYRRDEIFPLPFLKEVCKICLETRIGQFYATPWKSVIVKNIESSHRVLWDYILGKHAINVRHAANELNWQVEDSCEDGLVIKRHIIRHFDKADTRTYGLCFNVSIRKPTSHFGSIVIRRQTSRQTSDLKYLQRYDILHTQNFEANNTKLEVYREGVTKEQLGTYIVSLCRKYYDLNSHRNTLNDYLPQPTTVVQSLKPLYQCKDCLTIYDEAVGDSEQQIKPGTAFADLPADYCCSVCGGMEFIGYEGMV